VAGDARTLGCGGTNGCEMSYLKGSIRKQNSHFATCFRHISRGFRRGCCALRRIPGRGKSETQWGRRRIVAALRGADLLLLVLSPRVSFASADCTLGYSRFPPPGDHLQWGAGSQGRIGSHPFRKMRGMDGAPGASGDPTHHDTVVMNGAQFPVTGMDGAPAYCAV